MWSNLFTKQRTDAIVKSSEFMEAKRLEDLALKNALGIVIPETIEDSTYQEQRNNVLPKNTGKEWDPLLEHLMQRFGYKKLRSILKTDKHCDINSDQLHKRRSHNDSPCSPEWIEVVKRNHSENQNDRFADSVSSDSAHHKRKRLQCRQNINRKIYTIADEHFHKTEQRSYHATRSLSASSSNSEFTKKSTPRKEGNKSSNDLRSIRSSRSTCIPKHKQKRSNENRNKQSGNSSNSPHSCDGSASCRFSNKRSSKLSSKRDAKREDYKSHRSYSNNSSDS
ncbi:hypothetical protein GJ496_007798 [Pomphorhynchus laevis]|nr:hypothetical protein GJ496_007798 [Pomphorhynchus laevis]